MDWVRAFNRSVVEEGTSSMMLKRLKQAWKRDRLGVLGVGLLLAAPALWAMPFLVVQVPTSGYSEGYDLIVQEFWQALPVSKSLAGTNNALDITLSWFPSERIPTVALLISFAMTLFLVRWMGPPRVALERIKQAWKGDRLGLLGVGSAITAFLLWALPVGYSMCNINFLNNCISGGLLYISNDRDGGQAFLTPERIEAVGAFLALAVILLLLRRR
jgi:hypothetical protein